MCEVEKMSESSTDYRFLKHGIMDMLLRIGVSASMARKVAMDVVSKTTAETPVETIRTMIVDSLQQLNAKAAKALTQRFAQIQRQLRERERKQVAPGGEIYDERAIDELLEADEITAAELFFMEGREGRSWRRKTSHRDTTSVELAGEEYFED